MTSASSFFGKRMNPRSESKALHTIHQFPKLHPTDAPAPMGQIFDSRCLPRPPANIRLGSLRLAKHNCQPLTQKTGLLDSRTSDHWTCPPHHVGFMALTLNPVKMKASLQLSYNCCAPTTWWLELLLKLACAIQLPQK